MQNGDGVVIVDAGGGTIDISAYRKNAGDSKARFEEIAVPQCRPMNPSFRHSVDFP